MIKKTLFLLIFIVISISISAQNSSVGIYSIYEAHNEYFLLAGNDTLELDNSGITIKFQEQVSESGKEAFSQDYNLSYVRETTGSYGLL